MAFIFRPKNEKSFSVGLYYQCFNANLAQFVVLRTLALFAWKTEIVNGWSLLVCLDSLEFVFKLNDTPLIILLFNNNN